MAHPKTIDGPFISKFLQSHEPKRTKQQANSTANQLMLILLEIPDLTFVCRECSLIKGECSCEAHGRRNERSKKWEYRLIAAPWRCVVKSLIVLSDAAIDKRVSGKKSRTRLKALIGHLRQK